MKKEWMLAGLAIFCLNTPLQAAVGVSSLNSAGESDMADAAELPPPPPPESEDEDGVSNSAYYSALPKPEITATRLSSSTVKIKWSCEPSWFGIPQRDSLVRLRILKQKEDQIGWTQVYDELRTPSGEVLIDASTEDSKVWRFAAITYYRKDFLPFDPIFAASGAYKVEELDYLPMKLGFRVSRGGPDPGDLEPPGVSLNLAPETPMRDQFSLSIGGDYVFIENKPGPPVEPNPSFSKTGSRYFGSNDPRARQQGLTEFSVDGSFRRGESAGITGAISYYTGYMAANSAFMSLPSLQGLMRNSRPEGIGFDYGIPRWGRQSVSYSSDPSMFLRLGRYKEQGELEGFDDITRLAIQHLPAEGSSQPATRALRLYLSPKPDEQLSVNFNSELAANVTPAQRSTSPSDDNEFVRFNVTPNGTGEGRVTESLSEKRLVTHTLSPMLRTVTMIPLTVIHPNPATGTQVASIPTNHSGPSIVQDKLNETFLKQANIRFTVSKWPMQSMFSYTFPLDINNAGTRAALLDLAAASTSDFIIFYVKQYDPWGDSRGRAFSRNLNEEDGGDMEAAIVADDRPEKTEAHEIGHCLGLMHCWSTLENYGLFQIPDNHDYRLMGYGLGKKLRHYEIMHITRVNR